MSGKQRVTLEYRLMQEFRSQQDIHLPAYSRHNGRSSLQQACKLLRQFKLHLCCVPSYGNAQNLGVHLNRHFDHQFFAYLDCLQNIAWELMLWDRPRNGWARGSPHSGKEFVDGSRLSIPVAMASHELLSNSTQLSHRHQLADYWK